jgi:hypothetical protein
MWQAICTDCALHLQTAPKLTVFWHSRDVLEPANDYDQNAQVRLTMGVLSVTAVYVGTAWFSGSIDPIWHAFAKAVVWALTAIQKCFYFRDISKQRDLYNCDGCRLLDSVGLMKADDNIRRFLVIEQIGRWAEDLEFAVCVAQWPRSTQYGHACNCCSTSTVVESSAQYHVVYVLARCLE